MVTKQSIQYKQTNKHKTQLRSSTSQGGVSDVSELSIYRAFPVKHIEFIAFCIGFRRFSAKSKPSKTPRGAQHHRNPAPRPISRWVESSAHEITAPWLGADSFLDALRRGLHSSQGKGFPKPRWGCQISRPRRLPTNYPDTDQRLSVDWISR